MLILQSMFIICPIIHQKGPTHNPIQIVYDHSYHGNSNFTSLNDCLMLGPPFVNDLCAILLRFHDFVLALSTDIEKALLHVKLRESDMNFTWFLWPETSDKLDNNFEVYHFKVMPLSWSSSLFMLDAIPYSGKVWWGESLANWLVVNIWRKKVWWINRSAYRLVIVSTNLDGSS